MLCHYTVYAGEAGGRFRIQADEDGLYYLYFICLSSDPLSLKEGELGVLTQS